MLAKDLADPPMPIVHVGMIGLPANVPVTIDRSATLKLWPFSAGHRENGIAPDFSRMITGQSEHARISRTHLMTICQNI
jgi:hypothetical protein